MILCVSPHTYRLARLRQWRWPSCDRNHLIKCPRRSADSLPHTCCVCNFKSGGKAVSDYIPQTDDIVRTVSKQARGGDLVIVMSNGGFDDIHQKLLDALAAREAR